MDIQFLIKEKILTERIVIKPDELDDIDNAVHKKINKDIVNHRHRDGFVISVKSIFKGHNIILTKDTFNGDSHIDVSFLADIIDIETNSILYGCEIIMINKTGIYITTYNNTIKVLIPSDDLDSNYMIDYKVGDKIDIIVLTSRETVYNKDIIVVGKIYTYKLISVKKLVMQIDDINNIIDIDKINITLNENTKNKLIVYQQLGILSNNHMMCYNEVNKEITPEKYKFSDVYNFLPQLANEKLKMTNFNQECGELLEIFKIFKVFNSQENVFISSKSKSCNDKLIKELINKYNTKKIQYNKSLSDILIIKDEPINDLSKYYKMKNLMDNLLLILSKKSKFVILNMFPIIDLVSFQVFYILNLIYSRMWLFKPSITIGMTLDYYLILKNPRDIDTTKIIKKLNNVNIKDIYYDSFIDGLTLSLFVDKNIRDIRVYNNMIYKLFVEKRIEMRNRSIENTDKLETIQKELATHLLSKLKII